MFIVFDVCKEYGFFFVDSKMDYKFVVLKFVVEKEMFFIENEIFLDDNYMIEYIIK